MPISRRLLTLTAVAAPALGTGAWFLSGDVARPASPVVQFALLDGSRVDMTDLKGQVVLINFWATSCTTCVHEMPELAALHRKFNPRGYTTLAVAMSYDTPAYVAGFTESRQLPFRVAFDQAGEIAHRFGEVQVTPTSFLIDKHSRVVKRYVGAPDFAALDRLIERLLTET